MGTHNGAIAAASRRPALLRFQLDAATTAVKTKNSKPSGRVNAKRAALSEYRRVQRASRFALGVVASKSHHVIQQLNIAVSRPELSQARNVRLLMVASSTRASRPRRSRAGCAGRTKRRNSRAPRYSVA